MKTPLKNVLTLGILFIIMEGFINIENNKIYSNDMLISKKELNVLHKRLDSQTKVNKQNQSNVRDSKAELSAMSNVTKPLYDLIDVNLEDKIKKIRSEYQRINGLSTIKKRFNWESDGCGSGTITYFLFNNEILKTVETGFIGDGGWVTENYYQSGRLIFIFEIFTYYPSSGGADEKTQFRTYVNNNMVIRYMKNQKIVKCETCNYSLSSKEYKLLSAYNTHKFSSAICD
jgi:hypothetical protein